MDRVWRWFVFGRLTFGSGSFLSCGFCITLVRYKWPAFFGITHALLTDIGAYFSIVECCVPLVESGNSPTFF